MLCIFYPFINMINCISFFWLLCRAWMSVKNWYLCCQMFYVLWLCVLCEVLAVGGSCRNYVSIWEWEYDDGNEVEEDGTESRDEPQDPGMLTRNQSYHLTRTINVYEVASSRWLWDWIWFTHLDGTSWDLDYIWLLNFCHYLDEWKKLRTEWQMDRQLFLW